MAELWRALRALKALQAQDEREMRADAACDVPAVPDAARDAPELPVPSQDEQPIEPEPRANPGEMAPAPPAGALPAARSEARPARPEHAPCPDASVGAPETTQECATMRHLCATSAPPSPGGRRPLRGGDVPGS
jgi:hypothetical protein